jgi:hypothetical protein
MKRDFRSEFPQRFNPPPGYSSPDWQAMQETFECNEFVAYVPGLSPREHDERIERAKERRGERLFQLGYLLLGAVMGTVATYLVTLATG